MWFRLWDVDDPSANDEPIDEEGSPDPGTNGPDNRDGSWAMAGADGSKMVLVPLGQIKRFSGTDSCGPRMCKVAVRVGMQPGDNWRFCACTEEDEPDLRSMTQDQADKVNPPGDVKESGMLTAWRKLHVELDSMAREPNDCPEKDPDVKNVLVTTVEPGNPGEGLTLVATEDPIGSGSQTDKYEGGLLWSLAGGGFAINPLPVRCNTANWFYGDEIVLNTQLTAEQAGELANQACKLCDDDPVLDSPYPQLPSDPAIGPVMMRDFAEAYIKPEKMPPSENENTQTQFVLNVGVLYLTLGSWGDCRDLPSFNEYWCAHVILAYQGPDDEDFDPDGTPLTPPFLPGVEFEALLLGYNYSYPTWGHTAWVFVEASRDSRAADPGIQGDTVDAIMTHEVGHTALGPDDNPNSHNDIMTELGVRSAARFIDEDIATLRSLEDFTSWWW